MCLLELFQGEEAGGMETIGIAYTFFGYWFWEVQMQVNGVTISKNEILYK